MSIIAIAFSVVALVSTSLLWHSMCSAVRDNGGSISVFDGFSMFKNPSDDEKVVYATHDGENLTISMVLVSITVFAPMMWQHGIRQSMIVLRQ